MSPGHNTKSPHVVNCPSFTPIAGLGQGRDTKEREERGGGMEKKEGTIPALLFHTFSPGPSKMRHNMIVSTFCTEIGAMASQCKRMRLSADDNDSNDDDDDDVVVVAAAVKNGDKTSSNKLEVNIDKIVTLPAPDDVDVNRCLTAELKSKSSASDLTINAPHGDTPTRRSFLHTAEVIKARYSH